MHVWKQELQAESGKGFSLRLANEYVHFHLHCFFDNNDVPLGETKGAIDSRSAGLHYKRWAGRLL